MNKITQRIDRAGSRLGRSPDSELKHIALLVQDRPGDMLFDAHPSSMAILDEYGTILHVNKAWRRSAGHCGLNIDQYGVGLNYINLWRASFDRDSHEAAALAEGIMEILEGKTTELHNEFPCRSSTAQRWFMIRASRFDLPTGRGAFWIAVTHEDVTVARQAREVSMKNSERLELLLETTNILAWESDPETRQFTYVGGHAVRVLGYPAELWLEPGFWVSHLHPDDLEQALAFSQRASRALDQYEFEYRMIALDGRVVWIHDLVRVIREDGRTKALGGFMIDISERKRAEAALVERERRLSLIYQSVSDGIFLLSVQPDDCYRFLSASDAFLKITGLAREQVIGKCIEEVLPESLRSRVIRKCAEALSTNSTVRGEERETLFPAGYRVGQIVVSPIVDSMEKQSYIVGCIHDNTRRREAEKEMRTLSNRLIGAQETERRRIARELHDDLNQRLALQSIELEQLAQMLPKSHKKLCAQVQELRARSQEISLEVQRTSHYLHSAKLDRLGLVAAVKALCEEVVKGQKIKLEFNHQDVPADLPKDVALCIFRIVQESIRNVIKHSCAQEASLALVGEDQSIRLSVTDSGVGFDVGCTKRQDGLGLVSMRERLRPFGGEISIHSQPSQGTRIDVRVPLGGNG